MRAAVLHAFGETPRYEEFPDPTPSEGETLLEVRASALTRLAQGMTTGAHYAGPRSLPAVVGNDGVGVLPSGQRVYAGRTRPPYGMMAERTVVRPERCVPVPDALDELSAAALPNAGLSSWLALAYRAGLQHGETVLILGATGFAGRLAIAIAKYLGAGRVVAAGRNDELLRRLPTLGADATLSLRQPDAAVGEAIAQEAAAHGIGVVLDYLWGHPAEVALGALTGKGAVDAVPRVRFVTIGAMAGPTAAVPSAAFRSSGLELVGSGIGSVPTPVVAATIPKLWEFARATRVDLPTRRVPLAEVASVWTRDDPDGRRLVLVP